MAMYKEDAPTGYTKEQEAKISKLAELSRQGEMEFWDVIKIYGKWCEQQNWTDEWRRRMMTGQLEGVGMDEEVLTEEELEKMRERANKWKVI